MLPETTRPDDPWWIRFPVWCRDEARASCADSSWEVRAPLLLFWVYLLIRHWSALEYHSIAAGINLGIHEIGHVLFRPFGTFLMTAGGTIAQCAAPVIAGVLLIRQQRDWFGASVCLGWLGTNCFYCAMYCADAQGKLNLPLVSPWGRGWGKDGFGDWSVMLRGLDLLEWTDTFSFLWKLAGTACFLGAIAWGGWLLWEMHRWRQGFQQQREQRRRELAGGAPPPPAQGGDDDSPYGGSSKPF